MFVVSVEDEEKRFAFCDDKFQQCSLFAFRQLNDLIHRRDGSRFGLACIVVRGLGVEVFALDPRIPQLCSQRRQSRIGGMI